MISIDKESKEQLETLAKMESEIVNICFSKDINLGKLMLNNSIDSFVKNYIEKKYGKVVLGACSEYRVFIVALLKKIEDKYQSYALSSLLCPIPKELRG